MTLEAPNCCPFCGGIELEPCALYTGMPVVASSKSTGIRLYYFPGNGIYRCIKCRVPLPEGVIFGYGFEKKVNVATKVTPQTN